MENHTALDFSLKFCPIYINFMKFIFLILKGDIRGHEIDIELDKESKLSKNLKSIKKKALEYYLSQKIMTSD